ncbi:MAG: thiamine pyrophosphate-dependent enzyme, partial [Porticoccaceae bacterium]|nr:thiamine pyrophosphate-dependent enzyme [Porticoccaceae bacterium]
WAIGSAIGAALAQPGSPVVCITGDGSLLMSGQELTVAVQEKLPVIFVILNDSGFGMVRHGQRLSGAEQIGADMPAANFATMARSLGADGYVVHSPQDLLSIDVKKICTQDLPTVLDIRIDKEEVPPIGLRIESIN